MDLVKLVSLVKLVIDCNIVQPSEGGHGQAAGLEGEAERVGGGEVGEEPHQVGEEPGEERAKQQ